MLIYPNNLNTIFDILSKFSNKILLVGGFVRDSLQKISSKDIDIEVYGIKDFETLENILKEFGKVNSVGKSFGVCKLKYQNYDLDFSLPRTDSKVSSGYTGFEVKIDPNLDFNIACSRRDFTINTIAYDVIEKKYLDPFNGISDLKNKTLRAVNNETFIEDPLRVFRAMQFCARFELNIANSLLQLCQTMIKQNMLNELPKERIYEEFKKLFLKSIKPSLGFEFLKSINALDFLYLDEIDSKSWKLLMIRLDKLAALLVFNEKTNLTLIFTLLCYSQDLKQNQKFIKQFTNDKKILEDVSQLLKNLDSTNTNYLNDYDIYKLALEINICEILVLSKIIFEDISNLESRAKDLDVFNKAMEPLIQGRDLISLGLKPSKKFSTILTKAYEAQMQKKFDSHTQALIWLKKFIH